MNKAKTYFALLILFSFLTVSCSDNIQISSGVDVTYIANCGFMISDGTKNILVDAIQENPWNYDSTPDSVYNKMLNSEKPFENIDLLLITHAHADHFHAARTAELLTKRTETFLLGNNGVVDSLKIAAGEQYPNLENRIKNSNPEWGTSEEITAGNLNIKTFGVNHSDRVDNPYLTLCYIFSLNDQKIMFIGDSYPKVNVDFFKEFQFQKEGIDILFTDGYMLSDSTGQSIVNEYIQPDKIVVTHLRPDELENFSNTIPKVFPNALFFTESMDKKNLENEGSIR